MKLTKEQAEKYLESYTPDIENDKLKLEDYEI